MKIRYLFLIIIIVISAACKQGNGLFFSLAPVPSQVSFSAGIHPVVDYINIMSYGVLDAQGRQVPLSMFRAYTYEHLYAGIAREKIIMGVPFYGKRPYREGDSSPPGLPLQVYC